MGDTKQVPIVNVAQIWKVDGILDIDEFRTLFQRLFITCPESRSNYLNLYCYLKRFGGYVFKKSVDHLEIDKHIVVRDLTSSGESTLEGFIVKWMVREKYVEERPLWEIALVYLPVLDDDDEGKDGEKKEMDNCVKNEDDDDNLGTIISKINNNAKKSNSKINSNKFETVVLLKMHHCLTDGYGFIHIVDKLTGNEAPYLVEEEEENLFQKVKNWPHNFVMILHAKLTIVKYYLLEFSLENYIKDARVCLLPRTYVRTSVVPFTAKPLGFLKI